MCSKLKEFWLAQVDSNHRPRAYQARALTTWAMSQYGAFGSEKWRAKSEKLLLKFELRSNFFIFFSLFSFLSYLPFWWRWWDSNPWPPACRAGALPAELHPRISLRSGFFFTDLSKLNNEPKKLLLSFIFAIGLVSSHSIVSIERRWSSRTFRYGYLVTT